MPYRQLQDGDAAGAYAIKTGQEDFRRYKRRPMPLSVRLPMSTGRQTGIPDGRLRTHALYPGRYQDNGMLYRHTVFK